MKYYPSVSARFHPYLRPSVSARFHPYLRPARRPSPDVRGTSWDDRTTGERGCCVCVSITPSSAARLARGRTRTGTGINQ
jgi:hypothetical protein